MELKSNSFATLKYHDIFDYPLSSDEIIRWQVGKEFSIFNFQFSIKKHANFYFINGRQNIIKTRLQNEKYSQNKLKIAKRAVKLISKIPTVKFVGITGSLAMMNSDRDSDIDLMIITKNGRLWTTRLLILLILLILRIPIRRAGKRDEKNKLCLNMWLDENDLVWNKKDRNIYTAHEIAQIVPLFNKDNTYENFLYLNRWVLNWWPNSVKIENLKLIEMQHECYKNWKLKIVNYDNIFEKIAYNIQYWYMSKKITREVVTPTRAIFHPNDWGKVVISKLSS